MSESKKTPWKCPTHEEAWAMIEADIMKEPDPKRRAALLVDADLMHGKPEPKESKQDFMEAMDRHIENGFRLQNRLPMKRGK